MSANSGQEIYNRVIVEGTGADGEKMSVERTAGQQAGVALNVLSAPAAGNPSFAVDTSTWTPSAGTTLTRDTTTFDTSPASGRWDRGAGNLAAGDTLTESFRGTFVAGTTYVLTVRRRTAASFMLVTFDFGDLASGDFTRVMALVLAAFATATLSWTPVASSTGVTLRASVWGSSFDKLHIDSLALAAATPTLVDRRGFRRTHVLPVQAALTTELGQQIGDVWLAAHKTTPLRGTVKVTGDSAVRHILTGQSIPPSQLLLRTGDMLRLSHRVDPDTGGQGRDGRIAEVTWRPADDAADVALDNARTSVDALLERLAVVVGQGR
jgi:hypothetical protein